MSTENSDELSVLESEIYEFLPAMSTQELEELCQKMDFSLPETSKGKKNVLLRVLNKHLAGFEDLEDQGFASIKIMHGFVTKRPEVKASDVNSEMLHSQQTGDDSPGLPKVKTEIYSNAGEDLVALLKGIQLRTETSDDSLAECLKNIQARTNTTELAALLKKTLEDFDQKSVGTGSDKAAKELQNFEKRDSDLIDKSKKVNKTVEYTKLSTFKMTGTIGGEKGNMSFDDLNFQIRNAEKQGYAEESIIGAVIKSISSEYQDLRTIFELQPEITLDEMLDILEPIFKQKDSAAYFADLCNAVQKGTQSVMAFVVSLLCLKHKILVRSKEEGTPFDPNLLMKQLMKSMYSGVKNTNIRTEIRENCRGIRKMTQAALLKIVGEAVNIEAERAEKFSTKGGVCSLDTDGSEDGMKPTPTNNKNKDNYLPAQVLEIKLAHEKQISQLTDEMSEVKSLLTAVCTMLNTPNNNFAAQNNCPPTPQNNDYWKVFHDSNLNVNTPPWSPQQQQSANNKKGVSFGNNQNQGNQNRKQWPNRKPPPRCANCVSNNLFKCFHCLICMQDGHKAEACPDKKPKN